MEPNIKTVFVINRSIKHAPGRHGINKTICSQIGYHSEFKELLALRQNKSKADNHNNRIAGNHIFERIIWSTFAKPGIWLIISTSIFTLLSNLK